MYQYNNSGVRLLAEKNEFWYLSIPKYKVKTVAYSKEQSTSNIFFVSLLFPLF